MLVQFSVENFRVFREKQTFSMIVDSRFRRRSEHHSIQTEFSAVPFIHRQAAIFGENGAGKTSLIRAMLFMKSFVRQSFGDSPNESIETHPFLYHADCINAPSRFEIDFILNDTLFEYSIALSPDRIEEERLVGRPRSTGRARLWFSREYNQKTKLHDWYINSNQLKGERDSWKAQTRPNALFLSTAVRLNSKPLIDVYSWIVEEPVFLSLSTHLYRRYTAKRLSKPSWKVKVLEYFKKLGIRLHDIEVRKSKLSETEKFARYPKELQNMILENDSGRTEYQINFIRKNNLDKVVRLSLDEESSGTKALFDLAGPLLESLEKGRTVVVDELNSSLHPLVFHAIVNLFGDNTQNTNNAQLIFTTHDVTIPDNEFIDRDQIWLLEKDRGYASSLYSYSEFKPRFRTQFQKGYLQGRYGAIPTVL